MSTSMKSIAAGTHEALNQLYEEFPKKFKLAEVTPGELVIVKLTQEGEPDTHCVMMVQKQLSRTTRLISVGAQEQTSYHISDNLMDLPGTDLAVWLVQTPLAIRRLPGDW